MVKKGSTKVTTVRQHPRRVPVSEKNPVGITIVDRHPRHLEGTSLDVAEIKKIFATYDRKGLVFPKSKKLPGYKNADSFDDAIAVWVDYFNKKFSASPKLDPDVVKALIASESGFDPDPKENRKIAIGLTQITKSTLRILLDPDGEAKAFLFTKIRQKDLKDPVVSIALATRWLFRKRETAMNRLRRAPDHEELILEYKGLLRSYSEYKKAALKKYIEAYAKLKK